MNGEDGGGGEGGQMTVPPGFRFHPTDEELLNYYLRKKVSYEAIDLDVIREVDLNKLEPWDLKEKCRIGTGQQNEWYFFSHKDKKYPTGTRTNRATTAGFWKATGRDKPIQMTTNSKTLGMRKTLVFYTGRAPHGLKTDWIMHEYRLIDEDDHYDSHNNHHQDHHHRIRIQVQEDGWVVCRVFKKKNPNLKTGYDHQSDQTNHHHHHHQEEEKEEFFNMKSTYDYTSLLDNTMHLPLLFSQESSTPYLNHLNTTTTPPPLAPPICPSQNLVMSLTSIGGGLNNNINGDWLFLDKLLASNQSLHDNYHHHHQNNSTSSQVVLEVGNNSTTQQRLPFHYLGCDTDILKYSNNNNK